MLFVLASELNTKATVIVQGGLVGALNSRKEQPGHLKLRMIPLMVGKAYVGHNSTIVLMLPTFREAVIPIGLTDYSSTQFLRGNN